MTKLKLKKDDTVIVISGTSKGKQGKIIKVIPSSNRAIVEGVNMVSRHTKPNAANPQGGILKQESSINISASSKIPAASDMFFHLCLGSLPVLTA